MKRIQNKITLFSLAAAAVLAAVDSASATVKELISAQNVDFYIKDKHLVVTAGLVLDSLDLKSNRQVIITPIVKTSDPTEQSDNPEYSRELPSVLVNGRNMHISYERGVLRNFPALKGKDIWKEVRRYNGTEQKIEYIAKIPVEPWMTDKGTQLSLRYDPCGCGVASAPEFYNAPIRQEEEEAVTVPIENITNTIFIVPEINVPDVQVHAGRARIQFEVDRTALHIVPYVCRNGKRIDNRAELQVIDDSVSYALSDPNVELVGIDICGYASPESPYLHNEELADGRSKALAEYLADRYNLPRERVTYSSVPENWGEFREMTVAATDITEAERQLLLDLIDAPASTPAEYDRKEKILKTDPRYAKLYKSKILPDWFPRLRATTFALKTQLKDMDDEQLKEVFKKTPGKMSLQQFCRVARMYPADSEEFNEVVKTALAKYPDEQIAIVNAAIGAMAQGEFDQARALLRKAEQSAEVCRMLALMAESERNYSEAARYYELAGDSEKAAEMRGK